MGSKAGDFDTSIKQDGYGRPEEQDQSELSLAISKAVTQVLESSDWRALSFPLQADSAKHSKAKNAVKRPMNPFMLYAQAARKKLSVLYPDLSYAKLSKTLGRIWKSLDQAEKQPFIDEAERLRQKHKIDHPDYKFQPKRREKKRPHSPNKESFENSRISTGDVLKVLSSRAGNVKHNESQNLWAHTIAGNIPKQNGTPPPSYSRSGPVDRSSPPNNPLIPNISSNPPYEANQHPTTTSNGIPPFSTRFMTPPPPLQRATTASMFSPANYRIPRSEPNQSSYAQLNDIQFPPTTSNNYPCDLSLAIGNSILKCSPPLARPPAHLTEDQNQNNLLTGVNHILRDMFGSDRNSVM